MGAQNIALPGWIRAEGFLLAAGGTAVLATAMEHFHAFSYSQNAACPGSSDATVVLHTVAGAAATMVSFKAGSVTPCTGDSTITVDLKKNGTTMLSAVITLDSTEIAYEAVSGTLSVTAAVADDVLTAVVAVSEGTGTLGTGVFCTLTLTEDYPS